jgi:hypothetical protein
MSRIGNSLAAALILAGTLATASAETRAPAPAPAPSRTKLTAERLKELRLKWSANHAKLVACRKEVRAKGLVGYARWFYMEDCMERT